MRFHGQCCVANENEETQRGKASYECFPIARMPLHARTDRAHATGAQGGWGLEVVMCIVVTNLCPIVPLQPCEPCGCARGEEGGDTSATSSLIQINRDGVDD